MRDIIFAPSISYVATAQHEVLPAPARIIQRCHQYIRHYIITHHFTYRYAYAMLHAAAHITARAYVTNTLRTYVTSAAYGSSSSTHIILHDINAITSSSSSGEHHLRYAGARCHYIDIKNVEIIISPETFYIIYRKHITTLHSQAYARRQLAVAGSAQRVARVNIVITFSPYHHHHHRPPPCYISYNIIQPQYFFAISA